MIKVRFRNSPYFDQNCLDKQIDSLVAFSINGWAVLSFTSQPGDADVEIYFTGNGIEYRIPELNTIGFAPWSNVARLQINLRS